jgi:hypothetical protein
VKTNKDEKDFMILPHMQNQLLLAAIDSTNHASNTGGTSNFAAPNLQSKEAYTNSSIHRVLDMQCDC